MDNCTRPLPSSQEVCQTAAPTAQHRANRLLKTVVELFDGRVMALYADAHECILQSRGT
jgi:hypothetical protein